MEKSAYELSGKRRDSDVEILSGSVASDPSKMDHMDRSHYDLSDRRNGDTLQLISGSTGGGWSRMDRKQAQRAACMPNCCLLIVSVVASLALCVAVIAIILVLALPNQPTQAQSGQVGSTASPSDSTQNSEELKRIRESLEASTNSVGMLLERLVSVQENGTCMNPPEPLLGTVGNPATSCRDISNDRPSGYYWIQPDPNTCPIRVYCDLDGSACSCSCNSQEGGWMRVANLDMTDPNQNCPDGLSEVTSDNPPARLCGRPGPVGCTSIYFPVNGIEYSRVCGRVKAFRHASPDAFNQGNIGIDSHYVDGVSITHGLPRTHIWTFASSWSITNQAHGCPCDTNDYQGVVPSFVGTDYFCEGGHSTSLQFQLFLDNPLWDGQDCIDGSMCCIFNNPPYFCKTLDAPATNHIEVRLCGNQNTADEDTPVEAIELYVY